MGRPREPLSGQREGRRCVPRHTAPSVHPDFRIGRGNLGVERTFRAHLRVAPAAAAQARAPPSSARNGVRSVRIFSCKPHLEKSRGLRARLPGARTPVSPGPRGGKHFGQKALLLPPSIPWRCQALPRSACVSRRVRPRLQRLCCSERGLCRKDPGSSEPRMDTSDRTQGQGVVAGATGDGGEERGEARNEPTLEEETSLGRKAGGRAGALGARLAVPGIHRREGEMGGGGKRGEEPQGA